MASLAMSPLAQCDWGFAGDYVQGMWLMLQQNEYAPAAMTGSWGPVERPSGRRYAPAAGRYRMQQRVLVDSGAARSGRVTASGVSSGELTASLT